MISRQKIHFRQRKKPNGAEKDESKNLQGEPQKKKMTPQIEKKRNCGGKKPLVTNKRIPTRPCPG